MFHKHQSSFVWRGFLFLWVLGMGYVILLWHSLSLPYNYFGETGNRKMMRESMTGFLNSSREVREVQTIFKSDPGLHYLTRLVSLKKSMGSGSLQ